MEVLLKMISLVILILIAGCAGSSQHMVKATPIEGSSTGKVLAYFI